MSSGKRFALAAGLLLAVAGSIPSVPPAAQSGVPRPVEFEVADGPGAPSEIPGISKIEVALLITFDGPVRREDVIGLSFTANGVALPDDAVARGRWDNPRPQTLRAIFLLEDILKTGVEFLSDSAALRIECLLSIRGGDRFSATSTYDFVSKEDAPAAFRTKGRFTRLQPLAPVSTPAPTPPISTSVPAARPPAPPLAPGLVSRGAAIAEAAIGPEGGRVSAPGEVSISFPPGALRSSERIRVSRVPNAPSGTRLFFIDRDNEGALFEKPVEVEIEVASAPSRAEAAPLAIQELEGPLWKSLPSRYDAAAGKLTCRVLHFSPLGTLTKADVKTGAGIGIGTAVGVYLVMLTPAGVVSIPGIFLVGLSAYVGGSAANPILDEIQKIGLNMSVRFGSDFRVHWADNPASDHHIAQECFSAYVDPGSQIVLALEDKAPLKGGDALDYVNKVSGETARPFDKVITSSLPKSVVYLAAELAWTKSFYEKGGFAFLADKTPAPLPVPLDVVIYSLSSSGTRDGEWDGSKLLLNHALFFRAVKAQYASADKRYPKARQATVAHEYWHALYTLGAYHDALRSFDWFNECMGIAFESEVFPDRDLFLDSHTPDGVKVSLATGFAETGVKGEDADRSLRGYKLWPWGKFLLNRGYDKVIAFARGKMTEAEIGSLLGDFAMALVCEDKEIPDRKPSPPPQGDFEGLKYVIPFPEGMENAHFDKSISTTTGWAKLSVSQMMSGLEIKLGDAGLTAAAASPGTFLKSPRALSFILAEVQVDPPKAAVELAAAGTPPPVVVRRRAPEGKEMIVGLHPAKQNSTTGRRRLQDLVQGWGKIAVPGAWLDFKAAIAFPIAFTGTFADAGGSDNPVWAYVLLPPDKVQAVPDAGVIRFEWESPELGPGLKPESVFSGYRIFTQKAKDEPIMVPNVLLSAKELKADVPADRIGAYDKIGLAAEDAAMVDEGGRPLRSPIAWMGVVRGEITVYTSKPNPDKKSPFDEEPLAIPVEGAQVVCEFVDKGKTVRLTAASGKDGRVRFEVPLDVLVTLTWGAEKDTATCTAKAPRQSVVLGGVKIKTVSTSPIKKRP